MPGVNFNDLPANLQQKLQNYRYVAASVDDAIAMAKKAGTWTAADDKAYNALNGGKAWGQFDGFESSTKQFQDDIAQSVKENPATAIQKAVEKGVKRDVAANPDKYGMKEYRFPSGRTLVYRKDKTTGKETKTYYDQNNKLMTEKAFYDAENISAVRIDNKNGRLVAQHKDSEDKSKPWSEQSAGEKTLTVIGGVLQVATLGFLTGCSDFYDIDNTNISVKQITDNSTITELMSTLTSLLSKIADTEQQIAENTGVNNELVAQLTEEVKNLRKDLEEVKGHMLTIITNQETSAENAQKYYQLILNSIGDNSDLLALVVDQLSQSNSTLNSIKQLLEKNNADNKEILEAITKCKYSIDVAHKEDKEFQNDLTKMLSVISAAIANLPKELEGKFSGYFKAIILGIADNGAKIQALTNLLTVVNKNIVAGNTAILQKMDKMQAVLDALFAKFSEFDAKTTNMLNAIATAIANMTAKIDKIDLDKIQKTLDAILDKIGQNGGQMADMTKLLNTINGNVVLNGERQEKILEAIDKLGQYGVKITGQLDTIINKMAKGNDYTAKLDKLIELLANLDANNETRNKKILDAIDKLNGAMTEGFAALVKLGNEHKELQTETNRLINVAIDLLNNLPNSQVNLEELINAIKANTDAILFEGDTANAWLQNIFTVLDKLNKNVVQGDEEINKTLNCILGALKGVKPADLTAILSKLDEILKAIKDHKVKVVIEDNRPCAQPGSNVNEGEIDDINEIIEDLNSLFP